MRLFQVFEYERTHINFVQKSQLSYFSSERGKKWEIVQIEYRTNLLIQILLFPLFPTINRNDICFLHYTKNKTSIWASLFPYKKKLLEEPLFLFLFYRWGKTNGVFLIREKGQLLLRRELMFTQKNVFLSSFLREG